MKDIFDLREDINGNLEELMYYRENYNFKKYGKLDILGSKGKFKNINSLKDFESVLKKSGIMK